MPLIDSHKLIYIHIPKTGGTAITQAFSGKETVPLRGGRLAPMLFLESDSVRDPGHHSWMHYANNYPEEWGEYYKFSVVRDPVDRLLSAFEYAKMENSWWHGEYVEGGLHPDYHLVKDLTLDEVMDILENEPRRLKHQSWSPQFDWINHHIIKMVDEIVPYEDLNSWFLDRFGVQLKTINKTTKNISNITEEQRDRIKKIYAEDYDKLGLE